MASVQDESKNQQIRDFLKNNPQYLRSYDNYKYVADKFETTTSSIEHICRRFRKKHPELDPRNTGTVNLVGTGDFNAKDYIIPDAVVTYTGTSETVVKVNNDKGTWESQIDLDFEPKDDIELAALHKIDLTKYKISLYWTKLKSNGKFTSSVLATLIKDNDAEKIEMDWEEFLSNYEFKYTPLTKKDIILNDSFGKPTCLLLSIADFHLEKRTIDGKTLDEKVDLYKRTVDNILQTAYKAHLLDEIVYVTSNDFLHVDNYQESTTKLTPQQSSTTWYNSYEVGFDLQAHTIQKLKQFCNKLTVVHVPSNHSRTKEYYLVHALSVMFSADPKIVFNRTAEPTKCFVYGNTFIGMHHGDVKSVAMLPNYFASKFKQEWGQCKFSEIALADKHHKKEWIHALTKDEVCGTRMFICPSMSGEDIWHKDSLYDLAIKASVGRLYDKEKGFCGEIEERV